MARLDGEKLVLCSLHKRGLVKAIRANPLGNCLTIDAMTI
jgi:hypothetical protein